MEQLESSGDADEPIAVERTGNASTAFAAAVASATQTVSAVNAGLAADTVHPYELAMEALELVSGETERAYG
ncbi:hypothetical protein MXD63_42325, partial [Frankia sp. Cpl3]|nr:hypothetical protein [Frankia sp. Cpl3]